MATFWPSVQDLSTYKKPYNDCDTYLNVFSSLLKADFTTSLYKTIGNVVRQRSIPSILQNKFNVYTEVRIEGNFLLSMLYQ